MNIKNILRNKMRNHLISKNYVVEKKENISNFLLAERLKKIFETYKIDCVLDVGANSGQYGEFLRNTVSYSGLIISFEPDPDTYKKLVATSKKYNNWQTYNLALGKDIGVLPFNIMKNSAFNSFLIPDYSNTGEYNTLNLIEKIINIEVSTINIMLPEIMKHYTKNNFFLKIDTQGYDLNVFYGSLLYKDSIIGVQTEVSVTPIYKDMPSFQDSIALFRSHGYDVSCLYPIYEQRFPHAHEFDCIYLSNNLTS